MDGAYAENSVKAAKGGKYTLYKLLLILGDIVLLLLFFYFGQAFIAFLFVGGIIATVMLFPYLSNLEYEVIYVNGQFDFARILNGSNRKRLLRMDLDSADVLAPEGSHDLDTYLNNQKYKVRSFSSGREGAKNYVIAGKDSNGNLCVTMFEPSEKMLELIKGNPVYRRKLKEY
ncbi:MAG: hypothetical protein J6U10_01060 [Lachnospiraceae bacterium]|nr:hypothetical protein [Lachnospiraceae bacterium]MBP5185259.1 hypothetical protein [Lachnospiraceae bacterium]